MPASASSQPSMDNQCPTAYHCTDAPASEQNKTRSKVGFNSENKPTKPTLELLVY
ncbi:hypothetical protein PtB15_18B437 [Puccinia triticina]|nr:hypothetical protein PtB15_18B437 [Puccinia triticina]